MSFSAKALGIPHPRMAIRPLRTTTPEVRTYKGVFPPQRALIYDQPTFLLHHIAASRPDLKVLDELTLTSYTKTAARMLALLKLIPWAQITVLEWPTPERLIFSCCNNELFYDLVILKDWLIQAESLQLDTLEGSTFLVFQRC